MLVLVNPSLACLSLSILIFEMLSVIDIFCPFNLFLFLNALFRILYRTNFTIIGRVFPIVFLCSPIRCVLSMSHNVISRSSFSFRVLIITSSVISSFFSAIPCTRRQFLLEYCCYWCWTFSSFPILVDRLATSDVRSSIILSFFALSSSYSLNLSGRKFMDSVRSINSFWMLSEEFGNIFGQLNHDNFM